MKKRFNTAGPCVAERHYLLPPAERLPGVPDLVEQGAYFAVHAPRQTGKTTTLAAIAREVTAAGRYAALHFSCERARPHGEDFAATQRAVLQAVRFRAEIELPVELRPPPWPEVGDESLVASGLSAWARGCPRPLVLFFDEIDALTGAGLITVLTQLRDLYEVRPHAAPWSVALCGLRDVRDYKAAAGGDPERLGTSSPFNIKTESVRLGDFTADEVARLYAQHTAATGQPFASAAVERVFALTGGQPWLVNALAREVVEKLAVEGEVAVEHVEAARERLIRARATHLDSLLARLREPRVRRVIEPILAGSTAVSPTFNDDYQYCHDLGLVVADPELRISNAIYREVIARTLAEAVEAERLPASAAFVRDGRLDMAALLRAFAGWWAANGELLAARLDYHEVAPQLVLMAFLQRVVNGGGLIDREYGIGRGRIDLLIRWPLPGGGWQREAVEVKVWSDENRRGDPLVAGLDQLDGYLARLGLDEGALVVFDRRRARAPIDERVQITAAVTPGGRRVQVLRG
ncbi:MAG: AAA-like domain-containing protein [bacterium]